MLQIQDEMLQVQDEMLHIQDEMLPIQDASAANTGFSCCQAQTGRTYQGIYCIGKLECGMHKAEISVTAYTACSWVRQTAAIVPYW